MLQLYIILTCYLFYGSLESTYHINLRYTFERNHVFKNKAAERKNRQNYTQKIL